MNRPRRLFRVRQHGRVLYYGPDHYHTPNYLPKLAALEGQVKPGELRHVLIAHDDGCAIWKGRGCNCDPDVSLARPGA